MTLWHQEDNRPAYTNLRSVVAKKMQLSDHPEAIAKESTVRTFDELGGETIYNLTTIRIPDPRGVSGGVHTSFVEWIDPNDGTAHQVALPGEVVKRIDQHITMSNKTNRSRKSSGRGRRLQPTDFTQGDSELGHA